MEVFASELDIKKPEQFAVNCSMVWKETHLLKQVDCLVKFHDHNKSTVL